MRFRLSAFTSARPRAPGWGASRRSIVAVLVVPRCPAPYEGPAAPTPCGGGRCRLEVSKFLREERLQGVIT
jgi:hypothetical protein